MHARVVLLGPAPKLKRTTFAIACIVILFVLRSMQYGATYKTLDSVRFIMRSQGLVPGVVQMMQDGRLWLSSVVILVGTISGATAEAARIEFGIAELPGSGGNGDSFVVAIDESETALLAHARALIEWVESGAAPETSPGATILAANIVAGPDGINRNFLA